MRGITSVIEKTYNISGQRWKGDAVPVRVTVGLIGFKTGGEKL